MGNQSKRRQEEPLPKGGTNSLKPATSSDVASLANVSRATVSYVLNDVANEHISKETRARVLTAASQLGYVPHKIASSLRSGKSDLVLLPFFDVPYNQSSISSLQETALQLDKLGYTVMFRFFRKNTKKSVAHELAGSHPIGVILESVGELTEADVYLLKRHGVRAILAYEGAPTSSISSIDIDFSSAGECAARYLASKGHKEIAVIVPRDERILDLGLKRLDGVRRVKKLLDIHVERVDLAFDTQEAAAIAAKWKQGNHPTAVFTYNDEYAFLLLSALKDVGFEIPKDIALVGCDDLPICELTRPRLSSMRSSPSAPSFDVANYFHHMIQGDIDEPPPHILLNCNMVVRESS